MNNIKNNYIIIEDTNSNNTPTITLEKLDNDIESGQDKPEVSVLINTNEDPKLVNPTEVTVTSKKSKRVYWIDWLRIYASVLVILQHISMYPAPFDTYKWHVLEAFNSWSRPCVMLFMMISGIFFLNPDKKITLKQLLSKYIYRMVKCLIFWSLYYNIINEYVVNWSQVKHEYNFELLKYTIKRVILGSNCGHLWYMFFVIGLYAMAPVFKLVVVDRTISWYITFLCIVFKHVVPTLKSTIYYTLGYNISFTDFTNKFYFNIMDHYTIYFVLGYLLHTHTFSKKRYIYGLYILGIIGYLLTHSFTVVASHHNGKKSKDFQSNGSFYNTWYTVGTFLFFKYTLSKPIDKLIKYDLFKKITINLSKCSFGVYLIHMTIYHLILRFTHISCITYNPIFFEPLYLIILYALSFVSIYILQKIPVLREFVM